ncbi:hypothetical protein RB623_01770 [Mesorhizobium sp. LHD-90]|uniref:hypothetical protein n=1 Tax=Mesorhizobium sp. LHD-90 TaxID=3071414 RepID=UPI0027DEE9F8|nr:hypothetical protein [Mesorhizobium sp. LHD-90]MDQ6432778.1 hypothetical protein [Mesorhizobium sp. LHD-90]
MKTNVASGVLTALIYAQVVLCFAGAVTVLMRDRDASPQHVASEAEAPAASAGVRL